MKISDMTMRKRLKKITHKTSDETLYMCVCVYIYIFIYLFTTMVALMMLRQGIVIELFEVYTEICIDDVTTSKSLMKE